MNKKRVTSTIYGSILLLAFVIIITYAYLTYTINNDANISIDTDFDPSRAVFTATGIDTLTLDPAIINMYQQGVNLPVANTIGNINISLLANSTNNIRCTYDVVWRWQTTGVSANRYTKSNGAVKEYTIKSTGDVPISETQIPNYDASNLSNVISSGSIVNNSTTVATTQELNISTYFYNANVDQTAVMNGSYVANIIIENVKCASADQEVAVNISSPTDVMPSIGKNYTFSSTCNNGNVVWNPKLGGLKINLTTSGTSQNCNSTFEANTTSVTNLNDYIMDLSPGACSSASYTTASSCKNNGGTWTTTPGSGACSNPDYTTEATCLEANGDYWYGVYNENGFRYEGKKPNNYVWFNNEMWRIIGVFDEETTGLTGTRVKIIRDEVLDGLVFDKDNSNVWNGSDLQILLNDYYYYGRNNNGTNDIGTYCYGYTSSAQANCDYRKEAKGIKDEYRPMIENAYWKTGGIASSGAASAMYTAERNVTGTQHYIGLMYLSDYAYSPLTTLECPKTSAINNTCSSKSWLYGKSFEWTISPRSSYSNYVWTVNYYGYVYNYIVSLGFAARPVLYLKSSVYYIDGDGSYENPYIIGM